MTTTPTNSATRWRHTVIGASVHRYSGISPSGIGSAGFDSTTTDTHHAKSSTFTTKRRPARRGAPPH
ncbi:MAG: hypothetical protein M5U19_03120 [Microthrixaceae bacterium]|nr:hypothetical protein [Microthrixaceae bacterium]